MLVARVGVGKRRQVTLPAEVCERLGVRAGDELDLVLDGDSIVLRRETTTTQRALSTLMRAFGAHGIADQDPRPPLRRPRTRSGRRKP